MSDRRRKARQKLTWRASLIDTEGTIFDRCKLVDISASGARIAPAKPLDVPLEFTLKFSEDGEVQRQCEVAWRTEEEVGVRFILAPSRD